MITAARRDLARSESALAVGIASMLRGEGGPDAVAASQLLAETVLMWRVIMESKIER